MITWLLQIPIYPPGWCENVVAFMHLGGLHYTDPLSEIPAVPRPACLSPAYAIVKQIHMLALASPTQNIYL